MAEISGGEENDSPLFEPLDSETLDLSSYPLSLPSQPPDIRNWFSSYEYESPELDFASAGEEESATQDPRQDSPKIKSPDLEHPQETESETNGETLSNDSSLDQAKPKQSLREVFGDDFLDNDREVSCNLEERNDSEAKACQLEQSPPASDGEESIQDAATNGFIWTKKRERSPKREQTLQANHKKSLEKRVQLGLRRPLEDKTNCHFEVEDDSPECLGKWRCPRKSKPYVGPPLKQLRMERWIHRMQ